MVDFTIFVLPGAYATSVTVTLDTLRAVSVPAPRVKALRPAWCVLPVDASGA